MTIVQPTDLNDELDSILSRLQQLEQSFGNPNIIDPTTLSQLIIGTDPSTQVLLTVTSTPPTGLTLTTGSSLSDIFINVSWTAPTDGTASSTEVELSLKNQDLTYSFAQTARTGGNSASFHALKPNQTYGVRIYNVNAAGIMSSQVPASGYQDITTGKDTNVPATPTGIVAFSIPHGIVIRWTDVADTDVAWGAGVYQVDVYSDSFGNNLVKSSRISGTVGTVMDLTSGTQYWVKVTAITSSGTSGTPSSLIAVGTAQVSGSDIAALTITAGNIFGGTITGDKIAGNTISAGSITTSTLTTATITLSGGSLQAGNPPTTGLVINSQGLRLYNAGALMIVLDSSGTASFNGSLSGNSIASPAITGGTITSATITSSSFQTQLDAFNGYIQVLGSGGTWARVNIQCGWGRITISGGSNDFSISNPDSSYLSMSSNLLQWSNNIGQPLNVSFGNNGIMVASNESGIKMLTSTNQCQSRIFGDSGYADFNANNMTAQGTIAAPTKNFVIRHPLGEKGKIYNLAHACIEGPRHDLIYRGRVLLAGGSAKIVMDDEVGMTRGTFAALVDEKSCQVFLYNETGDATPRYRIERGALTISCDDPAAVVGWLLIGERHDDEVKASHFTDKEGKVVIEYERATHPAHRYDEPGAVVLDHSAATQRVRELIASINAAEHSS